MPWIGSIRVWASVATALIVAVVVVAAWPQMTAAVQSLASVDLRVLLWLVPVQLLSFWVTGETLFSFLRARGDLSGMRAGTAMRMSLEFNFANHVLPSGGVAGIAYSTWKLRSLGVAPSRGVLGQLVRFAVTFVSFSIMLIVATTWLLWSGQGAVSVLIAAAAVGAAALLGTLGGVLLLRRRRLLHRFGGGIVRVANGVLRTVRLRRRVDPAKTIRFLDGVYVETREVVASPGVLVAPFLWSFLVNAADAMLFWVALASFGQRTDPALVFVAYGLATLVSMVMVTPNGAGGYEVAMIATLVAGAVPESIAIAAVLVARVVLLLGTILFGWGFYQHSVLRSSDPVRPIG